MQLSFMSMAISGRPDAVAYLYAICICTAQSLHVCRHACLTLANIITTTCNDVAIIAQLQGSCLLR